MILTFFFFILFAYEVENALRLVGCLLKNLKKVKK